MTVTVTAVLYSSLPLSLPCSICSMHCLMLPHAPMLAPTELLASACTTTTTITTQLRPHLVIPSSMFMISHFNLFRVFVCSPIT